jgi:tetratricopeptide (TPR) repeat protein
LALRTGSLLGRLPASLVLRVLSIYAGASWAVIEIVDTFGERFGLPTWFFSVAVALLLIGLPIILATAMLQAGLQRQAEASRRPEAERAAAEDSGHPSPPGDPGGPRTLQHLLTWRRALLGGVVAFTTLGALGVVIVLRGSARVTEAYGAAGEEFGERAWLVVADFEAPADESDVAVAVREALTIDLQQSRYVNVYTRTQTAGVLRRMQLPDSAAVDAELAREIAQREGLAAALAGQVTRLGSSYVLTARVLAAGDGAELLAVRATASRDRLVDAVEALSHEVRLRLGESRSGIRASRPLPQVTTRSLDALRRYSQAVDALAGGDEEKAVDLAEAAIALDPGFAMAYRLVGVGHFNLGRLSESARYTTRAHELRDNLSERERLHIEARYAEDVLGDPGQAIAKYELILAAFPDDGRAANNLAVEAGFVGDDELQYRSGLRAVALDPYTWTGYANAIWAAHRLDRPAVAESLAHLAAERGLVERATRFAWLNTVFRGDWARADAVCDSLLGARAPLGSYRAVDEINCGALDLARGRIDRAVERLGRGGGLFGDEGRYSQYYLAATWRVHAELLAGRPAAARGRLEKALAGRPLASIPATDRLLAAYWVGTAAAQLRDLGMAYDAAGTIAADTTHWWAPGLLHRVRAAAALAAGDFEAALEHEGRAVESGFGKPRIQDQLHRAQAFDALGQRDSAIALYADVAAPPSLANGFESESYYLAHLPVVHRRLGELYSAAGDVAAAVKHYQAFLELWSEPDPALRPQVEAARQALDRLDAETVAAPGVGGG